MVFYMYIFYKIYLQWIYWTLFFIARDSTIFSSDLSEYHVLCTMFYMTTHYLKLYNVINFVIPFYNMLYMLQNRP
jgi:hypothetical protein